MAPESRGMIPRISSEYSRIVRALPRRYRIVVLLLLVGNVAAAALEVLALWLLGLLMSAITPGATQGSAQGLVATALGSGDGVATRLVALTATAFLVKNAFMAGLAWVEATFSFTLQSRVADKALAGILRMDYATISKRSASEHLTLLTSDLNLLIQHYVLPTFTVVSETLLLLSVVAFLLWLQPTLTFAAIVFVGGAGWLTVHWSRRVMVLAGQRRQSLEDDRMRRLREVLGHLREVYVYRAAEHARARLREGVGELVKVFRFFQLMATGPRFALEIMLVAVLMSAIVIGLRHGERHALIVSVGVFAAAGFRLLVGANRIIMSTQGIRFARPAMNRILEVLEFPSPLASEPVPQPSRRSPQILSLRGVRYLYPGSAAPVLANVDLDLARGTLIGIKGGSGSGKTTLLEVLSGLRQPSQGAILADGTALRSGEDFFGLVGYAGQSPAVFSDTIRGNVAFGTDDQDIDDARIWQALQGAHLANFVRGLPGQLDAILGEGASVALSGGQAQRLALARALYADCPFLLLDEPTSALDPATEADVVTTLCEIARERGVVVVSHRPHPLQRCDFVYEMDEGILRPT